jgi:hypothetical protein
LHGTLAGLRPRAGLLPGRHIMRHCRRRKVSCSLSTAHLSCNRQSELFAKAPTRRGIIREGDNGSICVARRLACAHAGNAGMEYAG